MKNNVILLVICAVLILIAIVVSSKISTKPQGMPIPPAVQFPIVKPEPEKQLEKQPESSIPQDPDPELNPGNPGDISPPSAPPERPDNLVFPKELNIETDSDD